MINYNSNINLVIFDLRKKLATIADKDKVSRIIAATMCAQIRERIHEKGLNASGSAIGTYKESYMPYRTGKRKVNGEKFNRTSSRKVVISLSKKLEDDFLIGKTAPIKTTGGWGLGFNDVNFEKSKWAEDKFGKIWALTPAENAEATRVANFETNRILNA